MTRMPDLDQELEELFSAACDGTLTSQQARFLESRLTGDRQAQTAYFAYCNVHSELRLQGQARHVVQSAIDRVRSQARRQASAISDQPSASSNAHPTPRSKSWLDRASRHPLVPSLGVAVALFVALFVGMALTPMGRWIAGGGDGKDELTPTEKPEYVAILNNRHDAVWLDDTRPPLNDPRLKVGRRLSLASGVIEIKYNTGAQVVLEGPAVFTIGTKAEGGKEAQWKAGNSRRRKPMVRDKDANSGYLKHGKLVARVEGINAKGFTIEMPHARVEDFGTEFGVEVFTSGSADVVVLAGEVDLVGNDVRGMSTKRIRLVASQGAFVEAKNGAIIQHEKVDSHIVAAYRRQLARGVASQSYSYAHWPFDDEDGDRIEETSANARHGRLLRRDGSATLGVDGKFGQAIQLAGGACVEVPRLSIARTGFTIAAHLRMDKFAKGSQVFGDWSAPHQFRFYLNPDGVVGFDLRRSVAGATVSNLIHASTPLATIQRDRWTHVAVVWNRNTQTAQIYVDARLAAEQTVTDKRWNLDLLDGKHAVYHVGWKQDETKIPFDGSIDELWVIAHPLSRTNIEELMNQNELSE